MKRIALKIDADTLDGTRIGIPKLSALLTQHQAQGTFFFSLGPDRSGCQARATSLKHLYNLKTRLLGRLLPAPNIGKRCVEQIRKVQADGFEIGIRAWDRVAWEDGIDKATSAWVDAEIGRAHKRFSEILADTPKSFAAPGWCGNRHALRLTQRLGYTYASDCRGSHPFIPVIDGEIVACPQIPTTLPTIDEVMALDPGLTAEKAGERILQLSKAIPGDHVFTLRAELEGMTHASTFEQLLTAWKEAGYTLVDLREIRASLEINELPRHAIEFAEIPGRPGRRMMQGPAFPLDA